MSLACHRVYKPISVFFTIIIILYMQSQNNYGGGGGGLQTQLKQLSQNNYGGGGWVGGWGPESPSPSPIPTPMYSTIALAPSSIIIIIDDARCELFTMRGRAMDALPPTKAALMQHIRRAVYQGGHCWGKMLLVRLDMPNWG